MKDQKTFFSIDKYASLKEIATKIFIVMASAMWEVEQK